MEFVYTQEQDDLRTSLRKFLAAKSSEADVRRVMETELGYDPDVWATLTSELGLTALAVPEEFGGLGFTFLELSIAFEEMGRALLCAPFLSACVASATLLASGDPAAQTDLLPGIAEGTTLATLAHMESPQDWAGTTVTCRATAASNGYRITGTKRFVLDGGAADLVLVVADTDGGPALFAVDAAADGVDRTPIETLDPTRRFADITLDRVAGRLVGEPGRAQAIVSAALDVGAAALAAEQVGGAQRVLDMSVEYAGMRVQFGRPIGSFQAIKHKCADMFLAVEGARAAAQHAAWVATDDPGSLPVAASLAQADCSQTYSTAAAENIQIHGGIGFTWEHPAHLYFRRAKSSEILFGDSVYHRGLLARRLAVIPTPA
ncbi:acyl-CoA dehydrogenase family protein [Pseudonocardia oroxyli]|uniref:Acyl-CoA dehydrogenase n=1 Tax=Pseudonocardia oroxyli TaxID=366584 RepID=A0A1G7TM93_PSEOR|nr:acyl-CoA dehydrogenase family protein [Pseudonocardia oroxyli]SDG36463.1 acyl-CoA dehydrogenase [Pseudonocardia oroxyli]